MGCCLFVALAAVGPRFTLLLMWLFTTLVDRAFSGFLVSLLGVLFLPWTMLAYVVAYQPHVGVSGFGVLLVAIGVVGDIATWSGGGRAQRHRAATDGLSDQAPRPQSYTTSVRSRRSWRPALRRLMAAQSSTHGKLTQISARRNARFNGIGALPRTTTRVPSTALPMLRPSPAQAAARYSTMTNHTYVMLSTSFEPPTLSVPDGNFHAPVKRKCTTAMTASVVR